MSETAIGGRVICDTCRMETFPDNRCECPKPASQPEEELRCRHCGKLPKDHHCGDALFCELRPSERLSYEPPANAAAGEWRTLGEDEVVCIGDEFECSPVMPVTWNPVTAQMIGRKAGRIGTILYRFRRHATNDREQPQCPRCAELERELDALQRPEKCPQCAEATIQPRDSAAYCEECGWPDENRCPTVAEWQDLIRNTLIESGVPDNLIDGGGCDSGDPLDFSKSEICQGVNHFINERDDLRAKLADAEKERDATWDALMKVETAFPEPWFSVGTPSELAKHLGGRLFELKAKVEELEKQLSEAETANALAVAKIDEQRRTYDFHLAERMQLQDRCRELEKALREGLHLNSLRSDMKLQDQLDEFRRIANAALGGKEAK